MTTIRPIKAIIEPQYVIEGAGVLLRRSFGPSKENPLDPFLLFDHFAFNDPVEGPIRGFPTHPHRGIETVTYILEGNIRHRDSLGNVGYIGPGEVQWMTSGGGILHEEMPNRGPSGRIDGFQLWVNLPARLKWSRPNYQEVTAQDIPTAQQGGVTARIVAGEAFGVTGPVKDIAAEPIYMDVTLQPGNSFQLPIPKGHTAFIYLFEGEAVIENALIPAVNMVIFQDGDAIEVQATSESHARFVLAAGAPFREPIAPYGPFVMNTMQEIQEALSDLRAGKFVYDESDPRFTK